MKPILFAIKIILKYQKSYFFLLFLEAAVNACMPFFTIVMPKYLLEFVTSGSYKKAIVLVILFLLGQFILRVVVKWISGKKENSIDSINMRLHIMTFDKTLAIKFQDMESPENLEAYEMARKCIENNSIFDMFHLYSNVISSIAVFAGIVAILSRFQWWLCLGVVLLAIINAWANYHRLHYQQKEMEEETPIERNLYYARGYLMRTEYAKEIRSYHLYHFITEKIIYYIESHFKLIKEFYKKNYKFLLGTQIVETLYSIAVYGCGTLLFYKRIIQLGDFWMYTSAVFQVSATINGIIDTLQNILQKRKYVAYYYNFIEQPETDGKARFQNRTDIQIAFEHVSFSYPGSDQWALEDIDLSFHSGEKISIVGENGSGKTTLIKLLLGLYQPTAGKITVNGQQISSLKYSEYIALFSAVFQDFNIYSFTVRENLEMGNELHDEKIHSALKRMGIPIDPDQYITQRYDLDGVELSGGENQKLAVARALCKDSRFIILDEPTAAMSPQAEYDFYRNFNDIAAGRGLVFISHRMSSCKLCDRIVVMSQGKIIEQGSHQVLFEAKGTYYELFSQQASDYLNREEVSE